VVLLHPPPITVPELGIRMGTSKEATGITVAASVSNVCGQHADARGKRARRRGVNQKLCNTKLCVHYINGACTYGDSCTFAHSSSSLRAPPDLRKTRLCKAFTQGCCNDTECCYAHGEEELRSAGKRGQFRFAYPLTDLWKHESQAKAAATPGATPTIAKMNVPLTGRDVAHLSSQRFVAQRFAAQRFAAQKVDDQCPTKAILPGLNSWPWGPTLDPPNALYAKLMPENLMRQNHNSLEEDRKIENCRTLAQEFGRLYEQARALSVNFDELQRKMPVASDSTSEGSVDLNFSCSRSEDMEVFSL